MLKIFVDCNFGGVYIISIVITTIIYYVIIIIINTIIIIIIIIIILIRLCSYQRSKRQIHSLYEAIV